MTNLKGMCITKLDFVVIVFDVKFCCLVTNFYNLLG